LGYIVFHDRDQFCISSPTVFVVANSSDEKTGTIADKEPVFRRPFYQQRISINWN
jgi:hypothetical protein